MINGLTGQLIPLCVAVFIIFWIVAAFSTKRTIEGGGLPQPIWIAFVIAIAAFIFFIGARPITRDMELWPPTLATGIIADVVTVLGLAVTLWARTELGGNWSSGVAFKEQHELIERGPYAYVRHPIYSGVLLMILGIAIFRGTLGTFILLAGIFAGLWFKALQEEKLLTKHFGEVYLRYKERARALIPFIW